MLMIKEEALQRFPDKPTFRDVKRSNIVKHQEELLRKLERLQLQSDRKQ